MARTIRNTKHVNKYGIRNPRCHNYLKQELKAIDQLSDYPLAISTRLLNFRGRIKTSYDDLNVAALDEKFVSREKDTSQKQD